MLSKNRCQICLRSKKYSTRHTFAAWLRTIGMNPNKLVKRTGHGSKKVAYEVYGNYVEGLEKDADKILEYFAVISVSCRKESL